MLTSLVIENVVLIEKLALDFRGGLNVLTGETGAGKSILMDALALALGARSDAALVRAGASQASVCASFEGSLPPALTALLKEQGLAPEEPLIVRRTIHPDGKSRAFVGDTPVSVSLLRRIGDLLVEIHGQFEAHGLLNQSAHRAILDAYAAAEKDKERTAQAYREWQAARRVFLESSENAARAREQEDFLRAAACELEDLAPQTGETERLAEKRRTLQNREKITLALRACEAALSGEKGAENALALAGKTLARFAEQEEEMKKILAHIDSAAAEAQEAENALLSFIRNIENDSLTLENIEERLFKIRAVARKHGCSPEELPALQETLTERLALLDHQGGELERLKTGAQTARGFFEAAANTLSALRKKAGQRLAREIGKELVPLKLGDAVFSVLCETLPENGWSADGRDHISFLAETNKGSKAGPIHKIASGGELSRFMLALKVVLAKAMPVPTLVFDEVDAGIGGATAAAVGERLARLGHDVQVLVVTHSPQIAARGTHHIRVEKNVKGARALTRVESLSKQSRIEEVARMLAGEKTTDAARKAAESLIAQADAA